MSALATPLIPVWPDIEHLPSPTNDALSLCQEYAMRTGGYDDKARVWSRTLDASVTFASMIERLGVEGAIRDVQTCAWLSRDDHPGGPSGPCIECAEARHA